MPNPTVRASATDLPISNRRLFLAAGTAAAVFATVKRAAAVTLNGDAEIIALSAEVLRLGEVADEITAARIEPSDDRFHALMHEINFDRTLSKEQRFERALAFDIESGRNAAIDAQREIDGQADAAFARMMAIPCTTQEARAAKVRALLVHVLRSEWLGPDSELEWDKSMARALLGEFAGMSAEELAKV